MIKETLLGLAALCCVGISQVSAEDLDRRIVVNNHASKRVVKMFASPIDDANYHYNMIRGAGDWIRSGGSKVADIDDGTGYCRYDMKAVLADGRETEVLNVNVCVHPGQPVVHWDIYD